MASIKLFVVGALVLLSAYLRCQCPSAGFTVTPVCGNQPLQLNNTSVNGTTYSWDFCSGELGLDSIPLALLDSVGGFPSAVKVVRDGNEWFVFILNNTTNEFIRIRLGSSLGNASQSFENLGTFGGLINTPYSINFIYENNTWYALVLNNISLVRLNFGNSLQNTPTASLVTGPTGMLPSGCRKMVMAYENNELIGVITNTTTRRIRFLNFRNSITNNITAADTLTSATLTFANNLYGLDIIRDCDNWYGVASALNYGLFKINFGSVLYDNVMSTDSFSNITNVYDILVRQENAEFKCFAVNSAASSVLRYFNLGGTMANVPQLVQSRTLPGTNLRNLEIASENSRWYIFNVGSNRLRRRAVHEPCQAVPMLSNAFEPQGVQYNTVGNFSIGLTSTNNSGGTQSTSAAVQFLPLPLAAFGIQDACENTPVSITDSSSSAGGISAYLWSFGDGDSSVAPNPIKVYLNEGTFLVSLQVTNAAGCKASAQRNVIIYDKPSAIFGWLSACSGKTVQFTDSSTVNNASIAQWQWQFSNGSNSLQQNPGIIFTTPGTKQATLQITTNQGCSDTITKTFTIPASPTSTAIISNNCFGDTTVFTDASIIDTSATIISYNWSFGDGNVSTSQHATNLYNVPGQYAVQLITTADNSCSDTLNVTITISSPPATNFAISGNCTGTPIQFTDLSVANNPVTQFNWDFGDGTTSNLQNPIKYYDTAGAYNVQLCAGYGQGCDSCITKTVTILPSPNTTIQLTNACVNHPVNLVAQTTIPPGQSAISYVWDLGNGTVVNQASTIYSYPSAGVYAISFSVTTDSGCVALAQDTLVISPTPDADFSFYPSCSGLLVAYQDASTPALSITSREWHFGDGTTSTLSSPSHSFSAPNYYNTMLVVTNTNGCTDTTIKQVAPLFASIQAPDSVCTAEQFLPVVSTSAVSPTYAWDFCSGELSLDSIPVSLLDSVSGFPSVVKPVFDGNEWFIFILNNFTNEFFRANLGSSLSNPVQDFDTLGNIGGLFNSPYSISFVKENNNWYAFVLNNISLVRLSFGNSLQNQPTASLVTGPNGMLASGCRKLVTAYENNELIALITNTTNRRIRLLNFRNSVTNNITPADTLTTPTLSFANGLYGLDVIRDCDSWYGVASALNYGLFKINFGNVLYDNALSTDSFSNITNVYDVAARLENAQFKCFAVNSAASSTLFYFNFGSKMSNNVQFIQTRSLNGVNSRNLNLAEDNSRWYIFYAAANRLRRHDVYEPCSASPMVSVQQQPYVFYSQSGTQKVSVTLNSSDGLILTDTANIFVRAGTISNFDYSGVCFPETTQFIDSSLFNGFSPNWFWRFDTLGTSLAQSPTFTFPAIGDYTVKLITQGGGCSDTLEKVISISENPVANFSYTASCQRDSSVFTDLSTFNFDTIVAWKWEIAGILQDSIQSPVFFIDTFGTIPVSLTVTNTNGCTNTKTQSIFLHAKPVFDVEVQNTCVGRTVEFDNASFVPGGGSFNNYMWDFGDGAGSLSFSTSHNYTATVANYNAVFNATTTAGCVDSLVLPIRISTPANPDFIVPQVCEKNIVQFVDVSTPTSDTIIAWKWSFGTGDSSLAQTPQYSFPISGNFPVTLTVITPTNCDTSITKSVQVIPSPVIQAVADSVCSGSSTTFTNLSTIPAPYTIAYWNWIFGDGFSDTTLSPKHTYTQPGLYTATLVATSNVGCVATANIPALVYSTPLAAFSQANVICAQTDASFVNLSTVVFPSVITSQNWDFGDGSTSVLTNPTHSYQAQGNYKVQLRVLSDKGCIDTAENTVEVFAPLNAQFNVAGYCVGDSTYFTDATNSLSIVGYLWNFGDQSLPSTQKNPTHKYNNAGNYNVTLQVENAIGCVDDITQLIEVVNKPQSGINNLTACVNEPYSPQDVTVTNPSDPVVSSIWTLHGATYNNSTPSVVFANAGEFPVSLTSVTAKGCVDSASATISVKPLPEALFTFSPYYGQAPVTINFDNQSTGATSYSWAFGDGSTSANENPVYTYLQDGDYDIVLEAISDFGCKDTQVVRFSAVPTSLDISVDEITYTTATLPEGSTEVKLKATISNVGTRVITNYTLYATLGSGGTIAETWNGQLFSGQVMEYVFNAGFVKTTADLNSFACVNAVSVNNGEDENVISNNRQCVSLDNLLQVVGPLPNPSRLKAVAGIILPKAGSVQIWVSNSLGQYVVPPVTLTLPEGRTDYELPVAQFLSSTYVLNVVYNDEKITRKFVVQR